MLHPYCTVEAVLLEGLFVYFVHQFASIKPEFHHSAAESFYRSAKDHNYIYYQNID